MLMFLGFRTTLGQQNTLYQGKMTEKKSKIGRVSIDAIARDSKQQESPLKQKMPLIT